MELLSEEYQVIKRPRVYDRLTSLPGAVGLLVIAYVLISVYLGSVLKFEFFREDVRQYWEDSLDWQHPFNSSHVPGYPLMIALARGISFGSAPPIMLMKSITFAALLISALYIYKLICGAGIDKRYAILGVVLFGLWPFVGVVYVADPYADTLAVAFFLAGLHALQGRRLLVAALLLGLVLLIHKAMWPFVAFTAIAWFSYNPKPAPRSLLVSTLILVLPLGVLWLLGSIYHDSVTWLFSKNLQVEIASRSTLPVLDGLVGSMFSKGLAGIIKSGIVFAVMLLAIALSYACYKSKAPESRYGIAIAASVLLLCVVLNHYEIWAAVRFSKLLVLPLMWGIGYSRVSVRLGRNIARAVVPLIAVLLITQFLYAWYMARVFYQ